MTKLNAFDLNLLLVFDAMLRERSVTKAASDLGLSQPAMSHALNRLRLGLSDRLFVRSPEGMMPTPRAEQLSEPIRRALMDLQRTLEPEDFVPATADRRFTVAVNNGAAIVLIDRISCDCRSLAPTVRLAIRPSGVLDVPAMLDRGELDAAIVGQPPPGARFSTRVLVEDQFVVVMRRGHPLAEGSFDARALAAVPHFVVSSNDHDFSFVDREFRARGLTRTVALEAPFLSAAPLLTQTDMVAIMERRVAEAFRRAHPVELAPLPFPSATPMSVMVWHCRFDDHPAHRWLRKRIVAAAANL
ncbi:LysR family transcriptional regulator [Phenylobacterium sp.]|uniref:LysR family transcriptional regulator n=1 Tax=Phenylobacterium sp. TaxID=1871053 RepID=UPI0025EDD5EE|nr:LysR family transcriptional regulator [Phenylobacterium sp.]